MVTPSSGSPLSDVIFWTFPSSENGMKMSREFCVRDYNLYSQLIKPLSDFFPYALISDHRADPVLQIERRPSGLWRASA